MTHMSRAASASPLYQLAHRYGVQTAYLDATGQERQASPEALLYVLRVLGAPVEKAGAARAALRERVQEEWRRGVEPVHVLWEGEPASLPLRLPARQARGALHCRLALEDGSEQPWVCRLDDLAEAGRARVGRAVHVVKELELPGRLPLGCHRLTLELPGAVLETRLLSAPGRAYRGTREGRTWGAFLPLYALQSQHSWGCGDFSDLERLLGWVGSQGGGLVGTLPLLAAFLDDPCEPSPYSPVSRLFWNELYVDVNRAPEMEACPEAREHMRSAGFVEELLLLRDAPGVEYRRAMALKRHVLELLARFFFGAPSERRAAFERFLREDPRVEDYAAFRAVQERRRRPWPEWPGPLRDGQVTPADYNEDARRYHLYAQWLASEQMKGLAARARALGPGLYLDLPLGVHAHGYDTWRERSAFARGVSGGAPPDIVFPRGQNWGFAPLHPEGIRASGHEYVRAYVRKQLDLAGVLRIDHMPSFHRVFWVPDGMEASEGVYVRYPSEELYALFNLESHRHRTQLVGEDLGTVPPEVPEAMDRHGVGRMYVIEYELKTNKDRALPEPAAETVASVNTHDMAPFAAYWQGQDVDQRRELGLVSEEATAAARAERRAMCEALEYFLRERGLLGPAADAGAVLQGCLRYLTQSPARTVLVSLEDLWLETRSQNVPSTTDEYANWRRKARHALEEIERLPEVRDLLAEVDRLVHRRGRSARDEPAWEEATSSRPEAVTSAGGTAPAG
jgi:4-alpha-glucanotransferase